MRMPALLFNSIALLALLSGLAHAQEPATVQDDRLVDAQGMTLYTYGKDSEGQSNCTEQCADIWPPLIAKEGAQPSGEWSLVTRPDGTLQWAYDGKPLYTYAKDKQPGDTTGDTLMGVWHVAKP
ncbi:MAG TPA: hypothetical protein VL178_05215 [Pseudomonas sp.]|nr:hypothetical protein [Pseudomonas sp.]